MRIKAMILTAEDNEYTTKSGTTVKESNVTLLDRDQHQPMKDTFDIRVPDVPAAHINGKLRDKVVEVDISGFEVWRGRLRAEGKIVNLEMPMPEKPAKAS